MKIISTLMLSLLAATIAVSAHHSFAAEYDADKPVTLSGTIWLTVLIHGFQGGLHSE